MDGTRTRPWLVVWRSHEFEHNGRGGSRYASLASAVDRAQRESDNGCWAVSVWYSPVSDDPSWSSPKRVNWEQS